MVRYGKDKKKTKKVVNKEEKKTRDKAKNVGAKSSGSKSSSGGFYYSFLTIILILCLIQISVSAVLNVSKVISYKAKIVQITKTRDSALALNEQLKDNIKNFSNVAGLEAIARNNLKMSSEDEVLVIINDSSNNEEKEVKPKKLGFIRND